MSNLDYNLPEPTKAQLGVKGQKVCPESRIFTD